MADERICNACGGKISDHDDAQLAACTRKILGDDDDD